MRSFSPLIARVLVTERLKVGVRNSFWNWSNPHHSLPKMPWLILKFLKAMTIPPMGIYLKTKK